MTSFGDRLLEELETARQAPPDLCEHGLTDCWRCRLLDTVASTLVRREPDDAHWPGCSLFQAGGSPCALCRSLSDAARDVVDALDVMAGYETSMDGPRMFRIGCTEDRWNVHRAAPSW